jgi:peroxiredoxin
VSNPLADSLDQAFQNVRGRAIPLADRLQFIADEVRSLSPFFAESVDSYVARLLDAGAGHSAPQIGDRMPSFILPNDEGQLVSLDTLLEAAPVAMSFYHGHWCPYCRLNAVGLAEIQEDIKPVQLVAISAETQTFTKSLKGEAGAHFPFLTDVGNGYALALNLAIWVDDAMAGLIAQGGWDIPTFHGQQGWILPVTSVFVVGQDGIIIARHIDADYRRRMEPADLLAAVRAALA